MKKIRKHIAGIIILSLVMVMGTKTFAAETKKGVNVDVSCEKIEGDDGFCVDISDNNVMRDYARNYRKPITVSYSGEYVASIVVNISYSYTDSWVTITSGSCYVSDVKSGYEVSDLKMDKKNGTPAYATVTYKVTNKSTKESAKFKGQFKIKTNGDVI